MYATLEAVTQFTAQRTPAALQAISAYSSKISPEGPIVSLKALGKLSPIALTLLESQYKQVPLSGEERMETMNTLTRLAEHLIHIQEIPLLQSLFTDEAARHSGSPAILAYKAGVLGQVYEQREVLVSLQEQQGLILNNLEFSRVAIGKTIDEIVRGAKNQVLILHTLKTYRAMRSITEILCTTAQHYLDIQGSTYAFIRRDYSIGQGLTFPTSGLAKQILPSPSETWTHTPARIETLQETQLAEIEAKTQKLAYPKINYLQEALAFCFYREAHIITIIANHLEAFYPAKFSGG